MLIATDIVVKLSETFSLGPVNLELRPGEIYVIFGENGSGKTTLLKSLLCEHKLESGKLQCQNKDWAAYSLQERAQICSLVPQFEPIPFSFTVLETVLMARLPWSATKWEKETDHQAALEAIRKLNLEHLSHQSIERLSGGERQRTLIARSLAQESKIFLLDEPTAHIDMKSRQQLSIILGELAGEGKAVVITSHDLEWATRLTENVILLNHGKVVATSLDEKAFSETFGVNVQIHKNSAGQAYARPALD